MSTRSIETENKYQEDLKLLQSKIGYCPFHDKLDRKVIEHLGLWVMYENDYPYEWAEEHYLLFTRRHTDIPDHDEISELDKILLDMDKEQYVCLKNPDVLTSVWCYHYHIIKPYIPK